MGLIFICLTICLFSIAGVCASDVNETVIASADQSGESIGMEYQECINSSEVEEIIASNDNTFVTLDDVDITQYEETVEIDVLEKAVRTEKNFIYINTSAVASDWSHRDYFFDYNDNHVAAKASDFYSLNLTLSPNTKYDCEFLGGTFVGGYDKYKPWVWNSGYQYSVMFKGNFTTDENGYICNFTHNQHYKFVFKING